MVIHEMTLKYNFNITQGNNLYIDALVYVNDQVSGFLVYGLIFLLTMVFLYVSNYYLNDMELSLLYSMYVMIIISIIFYYMGLALNVSLFNGAFLFTLILIFSALGGIIYYGRNKLNG